jgi:hypothetical protein
MIEPIMYFGIGFLVAALVALVVIPLIHDRAVRLTTRRLEAAIPLSMAEIQADKDQLRAEFAMSTRRLEINVDQLKNKAANYLAELGRKGDVINRLRIEREAQNVEIFTLNTQVEALKKGLTVAGNKVKVEGDFVSAVAQDWQNAKLVTVPTDSAYNPPSAHRHEGDAVPLVPKECPTAELLKVPTDTSPDHCQDGNIGPLVARDWLTAELVKLPTGSSHSPAPKDQHHRSDAVPHLLMKRPTVEEVQSGGLRSDLDARRGLLDQRIGIARERSDFSAELRAVEPLIRVFPRDEFAGNEPSIERPTFPTLARFFIVVLISAGASFAWLYHGGAAKEMIKTWILSPSWLSFVSATKSPLDITVPAGQTEAARAGQASVQNAASPLTPATQMAPAPAVATTSPELVQRKRQTIARDLAAGRHGAEQPTAKQEQMANNIATLQPAEPHIKHKMLSSPQQARVKRVPTPETPPTTIEGWTLLEVADDAVVLKGPNGIWRATHGDVVPGVGRVESVVRWGNRWIVATSRGLITTP